MGYIYTNKQKDASEATKKANTELWKYLTSDGTESLEAEKNNAADGRVVEVENLEIKGTADDGKTDEAERIVWSQKQYNFLDKGNKCSCCVNESLFVNGQNNHITGLFEVKKGQIYQVRGYDMANITFVLAPNQRAWIVLDTLMSVECTKEALDVADCYFGPHGLPSTSSLAAVFISHSHVDHFGGIGALVPEDGENCDVPIYVPAGFTEASVSENVYVAQAMGRRAAYQYGSFLKPGEKGSVVIGIGQGQSRGTVTFNRKVIEISESGWLDKICGLHIYGQLTPGTEAPAEMNLYFPDYKGLWMAENCCGTLHNLYTLRGAQVRDGNAWAKYLMEAAELFGDEAEVVFQSHNWPHWKTKKNPNVIKEYLVNNAAAYKYINDQTLLYMNLGYTMEEVAEKIKLPDKVAKNWYLRPYYGTPKHDAKAVYQKYLGWYDANPIHLDPLPLSKKAPYMRKYFKDADAFFAQAEEDFNDGHYRLVAEMTHLFFSGYDEVAHNATDDPISEKNKARLLCADALEQLGYQAESGTWRNAYLSGAYELRNGTVRDPLQYVASNTDIMKEMTGSMILDYMGIMFDDETGKADFSFTVNFSNDYDPGVPNDRDRRQVGDRKFLYKVYVKNGVILYYRYQTAGKPIIPDIYCEREVFFGMCKCVTEAQRRAQAERIVSGDDEKSKKLRDDLCNQLMVHLRVDMQDDKYFDIMERPREWELDTAR